MTTEFTVPFCSDRFTAKDLDAIQRLELNDSPRVKAWLIQFGALEHARRASGGDPFRPTFTPDWPSMAIKSELRGLIDMPSASDQITWLLEAIGYILTDELHSRPEVK